jgi:GTP-binding protein
LIDSRLPAQKLDRAFLDWITGTGVPFSIVFTKIDKQSAALTQAALAQFQRETLPMLPPETPVFLTSAKTKAGRRELLAFIAEQLADT